MMFKMLERITTLAILVFTLVLGGTYVHDRFFLAGEATLKSAEIGKMLPKATPSVVVALSTHCSFCSESTSFYKTLMGLPEVKSGAVRLVALFREGKDEASAFLQKEGVQASLLSSINFQDLGVSATPTLMLYDSHGRTRNIWVGLIRGQTQEQVMRSITEVVSSD